MAEGYAKQILPADNFTIKSAGIENHGLNPMAVKVMAEDGVDISKQYSKLIDLHYFNTADVIITLCGDAKDKCPLIPTQTKSLHWPLSDPAQAKGTISEQIKEFWNIRDQIQELINELK